MDVVVVGFGRMGRVRAEFYRHSSEFRLVGVVEPTAGGLALCAEVLPGVGRARVLAELDTRFDLVDICSPPAFHEEHTEAALTHGAHVLCEKPAVVDPDRGRALADRARALGFVVYPCHNYLHSPMYRSLVNAVGSASGGVREIVVEVHRQRPARGAEHWRPEWRTEAGVAGGGILTDHGTHFLYLVSHVLAAFPVAVACEVHAGEPGAEVDCTLVMRFAAGCLVRVRLSWRAEFRSSSLSVDGRAVAVEEPPSSAAERHTHMAWFGGVVESLLREIGDGTLALSEWEHAVRCAEVLRGAYQSAARGGEWVLLSTRHERPSHDAAPP